MAFKTFDVFVIGSGVAGRYVARTCAKAGLQVAIADNREYGGTCANRGCDPKKIILEPTELLQRATNLKGKGIAKLPELHWKENQKFKKTFTDKVPAGTEGNLKDLGITLYHQSPNFLDTNTLSVEGKTVTAKKIVIATGLMPRPFNIEGAKYLYTSDDFLSFKKMPKHIVFIGAGYVGMELAHIANRYGSKVTVIEQGSSILNSFDADLTKQLAKASEEMGIRFIYNAEVASVEKLRKNYQIHYISKGKKKCIKVRKVCNTSGRVPAIDVLDLAKGNVSTSQNGVMVNDFLQSTSHPDVYACGDVSAHGLPLSPLSGIEAKVVAKNIIDGNTQKIETPLIPSVVFTLPNLASVGLSEAEAKQRYKNVIVKYENASNWYSAKRINTQYYAFKTIVNERTNHILGAHILGPQASETINLFALAIHSKLTVDDVKHMVFTYPSWANDIKLML